MEPQAAQYYRTANIAAKHGAKKMKSAELRTRILIDHSTSQVEYIALLSQMPKPKP